MAQSESQPVGELPVRGFMPLDAGCPGDRRRLLTTGNPAPPIWLTQRPIPVPTPEMATNTGGAISQNFGR